MLNLRQLRQFVTVAELEHVGQAAAALNMSQSPLSRQVMQLEGILGLRLFERFKKRVRLTAEGQAFLEEARALLAQADRVEARARRAGRGEAGTLVVGYVDGAVHTGALPTALRLFQKPRPDVRIELRALRSAAQIEALRRREIDCGFLYTPPTDGDDLTVIDVAREAMVLAMPANHPLASKKTILPRHLHGAPWIDRPRVLNPAAHDRFMRACEGAGFTPDLRFESTDLATSLGLVAAGLGLALVQASTRRLAMPPGVVLFNVPWLELPVEIYFVRRKDDPSALVAAFTSTRASRRSNSNRRSPARGC